MTDYLHPLDADALSALGVEGWPYGYADRVRFHEIDALNHVNNTHYLRWFETIRVSYLRDYGFSGFSGTDADPFLVVRAQTAEYLAPMFHEETYVLTTRTSVLKPSSFVMDYGVFVSGEIRAKGRVVGVSLQQDGRTRRAHKPAAVQAVIDKDSPKVENLQH